jgi:hypothetical protein
MIEVYRGCRAAAIRGFSVAFAIDTATNVRKRRSAANTGRQIVPNASSM